MKKQNKGLGISLLFVLALVLGRYVYFKPSVSHGEAAPEISATLLNGSEFKLSALRGNYVLLDFWGSWCGPCRRENPSLVKLYNTFHGQSFEAASGFEIVSIAIDKRLDALLAAIDRDGLVWPYHIHDQTDNLRFLNGPISDEWRINEVPQKFLIGPEGDILFYNPSVDELNSFLEGSIKD